MRIGRTFIVLQPFLVLSGDPLTLLSPSSRATPARSRAHLPRTSNSRLSLVDASGSLYTA
jgi:hypothetical protein